MTLEFNNLPYENDQTMSIHRVSNEYVEFFDEPKIRLYRYGEKNRPYLSCWFALGSDWFPENKFLVFDHRVVIDLNETKLPFKSEDKLSVLADLIIKQHKRLLDFIQLIVETKNIEGAKLEAASCSNVEPVVSDEWSAMQPDSQGIVSRFYQTENIEEFIACCKGLDSEFSEKHLKIFWECLSDVYRTENALRQTINKTNS